MNSQSEELALIAARLVVEEGLEYAGAKRRAAREMTRRGTGQGGRRPELPGDDAVEAAVREHIALFCADTQPAELAALRDVALTWMRRLSDFRPHLAGAVWRGTATRLSSVHLDLFCDDSKAAEIALINARIAFELAPGSGPDESVLTVSSPCPALGEPVTLHLHLLDHDALRGALRADAQGRTWRGDMAALQRLLASASA